MSAVVAGAGCSVWSPARVCSRATLFDNPHSDVEKHRHRPVQWRLRQLASAGAGPWLERREREAHLSMRLPLPLAVGCLVQGFACHIRREAHHECTEKCRGCEVSDKHVTQVLLGRPLLEVRSGTREHDG